MEEILTTTESDRLRKSIMRTVTTRWLLTRKLPQVVVEFGVVIFLTQMARPRIFFSAVIDNAWQASSNPVAFAKYFLLAYAHTTPGVKMMFATMLVIGVFMVRDIWTTRRYASDVLS